MKRAALALLVLVLVVGAIGLSASHNGGDAIQIDKGARNPWTNLRWNNDPNTFHFAVVSDRTGGHRPRIFSQAIDQLNLLQPAFVVSVGDLIEGYSKDPKALNAQWREFQSYVNKLQMPFFYVPGNHDVANGVQLDDWKERFGRNYYHFVYGDVLFLAVCTDDKGEDKGYGAISRDQIDYFANVLKTNANVRWTVVMMHKPVWALNNAKAEGWLEIEKALEGRKYTVFAGHVHRFQKFIRNNMNYYQLATTGGGSKLRGLDYSEVDHITWVTMRPEGPTVAHVLLDGILPENMKPIVTSEDGVATLNRKPVQTVRGSLLFDGSPVPGAKVIFNMVDATGKKNSAVADAFTEADGKFTLSTYKAWDGAPVGDYTVTVIHREPYFDVPGIKSINRLPEKYSSVKTTPLKASVKLGDNDLTLELAP